MYDRTTATRTRAHILGSIHHYQYHHEPMANNEPSNNAKLVRELPSALGGKHLEQVKLSGNRVTEPATELQDRVANFIYVPANPGDALADGLTWTSTLATIGGVLSLMPYMMLTVPVFLLSIITVQVLVAAHDRRVRDSLPYRIANILFSILLSI